MPLTRSTRHVVRPASTLPEALAELRDYLVVPEWAHGAPAAEVAAEALRQLHRIEASAEPMLWALYTEAARRLGFAGGVPVPVLSGTAGLAAA